MDGGRRWRSRRGVALRRAEGDALRRAARTPVRRYKPGALFHPLPQRTIPMAIERTFSIIKPDATARNLTGAINAMIEQAGLAHRRAKARAHQPRAGRDVLCRASRAAVLRRAGRLHDLRARWWCRCWKARTPSRSTATSWARPIRPRRRPGPSARSTPNRSARTRCTVPTRRTRRKGDRPVLFRQRDRRLTRGGATWLFATLGALVKAVGLPV